MKGQYETVIVNRSDAESIKLKKSILAIDTFAIYTGLEQRYKKVRYA